MVDGRKDVIVVDMNVADVDEVESGGWWMCLMWM